MTPAECEHSAPARRWLAGDGLAARLAGITIAVKRETLEHLPLPRR
jgi:hypothetical protein